MTGMSIAERVIPGPGLCCSMICRHMMFHIMKHIAHDASAADLPVRFLWKFGLELADIAGFRQLFLDFCRIDVQGPVHSGVGCSIWWNAYGARHRGGVAAGHGTPAERGGTP